VRKSLLLAAVCAVVAAVSAAPAVAGEVTGSGKKEDQNQGTSWCSFSGLNDDPTASTVPPIGDNGPGGRSQSYGQENRLGLDPVSPGIFCNPNRTPFGPQPNRTK
jgi:opacity protein-like surface antigen